MWATSAASTESSCGTFVIATGVALLAFLPYLNGLRGDFVFDDIQVIRDNPLIIGQQSSALRLMLHVHEPGYLYRPLTMLTYRANALLDRSPFGFHLVNLILHGAVSVSAFALTRLLLGSTLAAAVAGFLFAVHAIHTEAVANIVGRAELLAALFTIAALLTFGIGRQAGPRGTVWRWSSLVLFGAGLLSKESAFTAVALYLVVDWSLRRDRALGESVRAAAPYALLAALYLGWRAFLFGSLTLPEPPGFLDNPLAHVSVASRVGTALVIIWEYLSLLILPLHLSADYSFQAILPVTSPFDLRLIGAATVVAALLAGVAALARRHAAAAICLAFAAIPMALTANILFPIGTIKAERLLYLPSLGFCMAAGWLAQLWHSRRRDAWPILVVCVVLVAHAGRTWLRNEDWRSNDHLFFATVRSVPESAKAQYNAGWALAQKYRLGEALPYFHRALAIHPEYPDPAFWIAQVHRFRESPARALFWYEQALALDWSMVEAHYQIGVLRYQLKEYVAAENAFRSALQTKPDHSSSLIGLSLALHAQGERWVALSLLDRAKPVPTASRDLHDLWVEAGMIVRERHTR